MLPIEDSTIPFLIGDRLDTELRFRIANACASTDAGSVAVPDRFSLLAKICRGKRVLHLGCCDHLPVISEKRR